jgi:ubiquinone biosynthesis protein
LQQKFAFIEQQPVGSASMAQVHRATLKSGEKVVVKVQRPGIVETISDDLSVLYMLAELFEQYLPETRPFNPVGIVDEYFRTLELETNFVVEANNLRRFRQNFTDDPTIHVPKVYLELTTERVLTMEALPGIALSQASAMNQDDIDPTAVINKGLRAYLKMVFIDGLFHGDLHAGNFFVMPHNEIGFVDFGVVGRLNQRTKNAISAMLLALSREDYEQVAYEFIDLAIFNDRVDVDRFARDLRNLLAPYYGLTLRSMNLGKLLLSSASVAAKNGVTVPTDLMLFFKSIVAVEGLGQKIQPDFDFLATAIEFSGEIVKNQYEPTRLLTEFAQSARDSKALLGALPRQLLYSLRRMNSPSYSSRTRIENLPELRHAIEKSFRLLFLAILISALLFSSAFVMVHAGPVPVTAGGFPTFSLGAMILALVLGFFAILNYFRK